MVPIDTSAITYLRCEWQVVVRRLDFPDAMPIIFQHTPLDSWFKKWKEDEIFPAMHGPLRGVHLSDAIRPAILYKVQFLLLNAAVNLSWYFKNFHLTHHTVPRYLAVCVCV